MDRIEFLHSIDLNGKPLAYLVTNYIDQSMLLYELIDRDCNVRVADDTGRSISFQIDFGNKYDSADMVSKLDTSVVYKLYDKEMHMNYKLNGNSVWIGLS